MKNKTVILILSILAVAMYTTAVINFCTRDGAFLGKKEGDIFVINTFITYDMMGGLQKEVLTPHLEAFKRGTDAADELILRFNNRKSLRTNQPIAKQ